MVLFLVSRNWLASGWCLKEFNLVHKLNKRLFGLLVEDLADWDLVQRPTPYDFRKDRPRLFSLQIGCPDRSIEFRLLAFDLRGEFLRTAGDRFSFPWIVFLVFPRLPCAPTVWSANGHAADART
jgi:hypothetical protein